MPRPIRSADDLDRKESDRDQEKSITGEDKRVSSFVSKRRNGDKQNSRSKQRDLPRFGWATRLKHRATLAQGLAMAF